MVPVTSFESKNIALFGLGGSGLVTAHALQAGGAHIVAFDDNRESVAKANSLGIETADFRKLDFSKFDFLVLAPGVPLTHPKPHWCVELAFASGVEIVGDIELFCRERMVQAPNSTMIAITGTNGKSTTTALISHVLKNAGRTVEMGGNIGRAVLDFDALRNDSIYVVEVSSYQIDTSESLNAQIGILLNLSPDHLDRHGSMKHYAEIKERLVASADTAIIGVDDTYCKAIVSRLSDANHQITKVSVHESLENGVYSRQSEIISAVSGVLQQVAQLDSAGSLRGMHNAQNACVAWQACHQVGLSNAEIQRGFDTFPGLVDRMEILGKIGDILIVNDSKGTNADATDMALGSFDEIYWIAGGLAKDGGIEPLRHHFPKICKAYLIGEAASLFAGTLGDEVVFEISLTLENAFTHALEDARTGKSKEPVILMSPACASFDQFPSYIVRGEKFRQLVGEADGFIARNEL